MIDQNIKPTKIIVTAALALLVCCTQREKKNKELTQDLVQTENMSAEYKTFSDKFYKQDLPLTFTQKTLGQTSAYRNDNILKFSRIENSELRFLKDSTKQLSPYFELVRTAIYKVKTEFNFTVFSYLKQQSGKDDKHEHTGPTYDKFMLATIANEIPIDTLLICGSFDQSTQISGTIAENLTLTTQRFDFLHDIKYDGNKFGIRAFETMTEYKITNDGHFLMGKSTKKEGDYKTIDGKEGYYPVDFPEK